MRLRGPKLLLSVISLGLVALLVWVDLRRATSPGPLSPTHEQERALRGRGGCEDCHGADPVAGMASACADCHEEIAAQLEDRRGLHGGLAETLAADCGACHLEHLGDGFPLVAPVSFERAGHARDGFDHATVEFRLDGRHDDLACRDCHPDAELELLPKDHRRFLGRTQDCESCHEDPHRGRMRRGCAECHGQSLPFAQVATFAHDPRFPLTGGHAGQACTACHPKEDLYSVEELDRAAPPERWRRCADCHDSPHAPAFVTAAARAGVQADADSCAACHPIDGPSFAAAPLTAAQHAWSGFALAPPHAKVSCEECHPARTSNTTWASRFPGRSERDCAGCHTDPHRGQFAGGPFAAAGCLGCHAETTWKPPSFGVDEHDRATFALTGAHRRADCADCHLDPPPAAPRRFAGTPGRCEDCHDDAHRGAFVALAPTAPAGGTCAGCHGAEAFAPARPGSFEHGVATGFPLAGAHARGECAACHPALPEADPLGRRLAFVADRVTGDPRACASCHEDVHRGAFDRPGQPAAVDGRRGCARCHDEESFGVLPAAVFDHGAWTDFALTGSHLQSACAVCHGRDLDATPGQRSLGLVAELFPGDPARCVTCHPDPHDGRFDRPGLPAVVAERADCARCHQPISFRALVDPPFDHARWASFPLREAHDRAACDACHAPLPRAGPDGRRHAFAAGESCADCHADPHVGQFALGGRTDCARCHGEAAFEPARFDHQTDSRFPLDPTHARLDCARCHQPWPLAGGGSAIRYKPLGTRCQDCHGFGRFPERDDRLR